MSAPLPNAAPLPPLPTAPLPAAPLPAAPLPTIISTQNELFTIPTAPTLNTLSQNKNSILSKHTPTQKMRCLVWKRLKDHQIQGTMFENMKINEDAILLDVKLLETLWSVSKSKKTTKNRSSESEKSIKRKTRKFVNNIIQNDLNHSRSNLIRCIAMILFRFNALKNVKDVKTVKDVINDIKNVEDIQDINYLDKITKLMPSDEELLLFQNYPTILQLQHMNDTERDQIVNKFPFVERFWYYCMEIPGILKRCKLQMLRLEFEEFCPFQYCNVKSLQNMHSRLYGDAHICKVFELVLNIGNYLNYPRRAAGFSLDALNRMKYSRSNQDQMYSLLIYLVEMVNDHYPHLSNWVDLFANVRQIDLTRMRLDFRKMSSDLTAYRQRNVLNQAMQKTLDKLDADFNKIHTEYNKAVTKCHDLAAHFGCDTRAGTGEFVNFCGMLINIKSDWETAQHLVERAKNIFIALICGFIREFEKRLLYTIPSDIIWWIYVYFPRWSLLSISKYLQLHKYQLNQYIGAVSNRLPNDENKMFIQHKPSKRMKPLQWICVSNIDNTIFKQMEENKENVCLDFALLEELWSIRRLRKSKKLKSKSSRYQQFAIFDFDIDHNRESHTRIISRLLFKNNGKGLRDVMLKINEVTDIEYLEKVLLILPTEKETEWFRNTKKIKKIKNVKNLNEIVDKFALVEQLWFYCMDIPLNRKQCQLQLLRLEVDEFCPIQYEIIIFLRNVCQINQIGELDKIGELILFIGNYLNYNHRQLGNAKGFGWYALNELNVCTSNAIGNYSLFMYLVDMVNEHYNHLSNWVNVFDVFEIEKCLSFDFHEMSTQITTLIQRCDYSHYESKDDDVLNEKMRDTLNNLTAKMDKLYKDFGESMNECNSLAIYYGLHQKYTSFTDLCTLFVDIKNNWNRTQVMVKKADVAYKSIVCAYCLKFGNISEETFGNISLQITNIIDFYLSYVFKCHLISIYQQSNQN